MLCTYVRFATKTMMATKGNDNIDSMKDETRSNRCTSICVFDNFREGKSIENVYINTRQTYLEIYFYLFFYFRCVFSQVSQSFTSTQRLKTSNYSLVDSAIVDFINWKRINDNNEWQFLDYFFLFFLSVRSIGRNQFLFSILFVASWGEKLF